jgi:hypothetical protein
MATVVGRQRHPAGAPAQSESPRHTSTQAPALGSHQALRHSKSLVHAEPIAFEPGVVAAHKSPTSLVEVWVLSWTSAHTSPLEHPAELRQGARQLLPQSVQVEAHTALRQSLGRWQLSPSAPWPEEGMQVNV